MRPPNEPTRTASTLQFLDRAEETDEACRCPSEHSTNTINRTSRWTLLVAVGIEGVVAVYAVFHWFVQTLLHLNSIGKTVGPAFLDVGRTLALALQINNPTIIISVFPRAHAIHRGLSASPAVGFLVDCSAGSGCLGIRLRNFLRMRYRGLVGNAPVRALPVRTSLFADTSCPNWRWDDNGSSSVMDAKAGAKLNYGTVASCVSFLREAFSLGFPKS